VFFVLIDIEKDDHLLGTVLLSRLCHVYLDITTTFSMCLYDVFQGYLGIEK